VEGLGFRDEEWGGGRGKEEQAQTGVAGGGWADQIWAMLGVCDQEQAKLSHVEQGKIPSRAVEIGSHLWFQRFRLARLGPGRRRGLWSCWRSWSPCFRRRGRRLRMRSRALCWTRRPSLPTCQNSRLKNHPGGNPGANRGSIFYRCYLREVAFERKLTKQSLMCPLVVSRMATTSQNCEAVPRRARI